MNNAETKNENDNGGTAARPDAWEASSTFKVAGPVADLSLRSFRNEAEVRAINCALRHTGGNRKRAAKLLSISYRSLLYKIRQHDIIPAAQQS